MISGSRTLSPQECRCTSQRVQQSLLVQVVAHQQRLNGMLVLRNRKNGEVAPPAIFCTELFCTELFCTELTRTKPARLLDALTSVALSDVISRRSQWDRGSVEGHFT
jgi:hypothetical protein